MSKTERKFKLPIHLEPTQEELRIVNEGLTKFYTNNPNLLKGATIEEKINEIIDICKVGWTCASKDFIARVQFKTKWQRPEIRQMYNYEPNYKTEQDIVLQEEIKTAEDSLPPSIAAKDLRKHLRDPEERKFWQEREQYYTSEFEFNNSADWSMLQQLLLEELVQRRLTILMLRSPDDQSAAERMKDSYDRLLKAQKALGISREQRESMGHETDGNIGQLVLLYEKKKKIIEEQERKNKLEESAMMELHNSNKIFEHPLVTSQVSPKLLEDLRKFKTDEDREAAILIAEAQNGEAQEI